MLRLQERSDRPQGWPSSRMHKAVDVRTPRQAAKQLSTSSVT